MKAISVRQPWAWLIINGGKDIENRDWPTKMRGRVLVHASKGMTRAEYEDVRGFLFMDRKLDHLLDQLPSFDSLQRGGIIGSVEIVDCVTESESSWFMGKHGFVLRDSRPLQFIPYKGSLGFFNVPEAML